MRLALSAQSLELGGTSSLVVHETLSERAALNISQHSLHVLLNLGRNHARARNIVTVLGGVRNRPALLSNTALNHQIHDQLQLVQHLKVRDLRLVPCLSQHLKTVLHQLRGRPAQHSLLTEQVRLGLFSESGLNNARTGSTQRLSIRQGQCQSLTRGVLLNGNKSGNTTACLILAAHRVPRTLRGDHSDIHTLGCGNVAKADIETVREEQRIAGLQVRFDALSVDLSLHLIRGQNHNDICLSGGLGNGRHTQPFSLSLGAGLGALSQANNNLHARITQVQCVGVTLRTVTDNRDGTALDQGKICIVVVENGCCHFFS